MTSKRIDWVDLAKGVGIILIVSMHIRVLPYSMARISAAWVPLFFFLSGLFSNLRKN